MAEFGVLSLVPPLLAIGLAIGMIGAIIPAVRAARMLPTDAFRDLA